MSFAIFLNSDHRYTHLANQLELLHIHSTFDSQSLCDYDFVFGPIPLTKDQVTVNQTSMTLSELLNSLQPHQHFFSCNIPPNIRQELQRKQIPFTDYNDNALFQTKNAIATAEGAIAWAITHSSYNLFKSNTLILGYGCCGKQLALQLAGFHTNLTIAGRRLETKTHVYCDGHRYLDITKSDFDLSMYSFIFNTIPAPILTESHLKTCPENCTIVDIASAPGGLDYAYVNAANLNATLYLGIPGKIAPKASADILYEIITPNIVNAQ